ncbi:MAG: stage III sporulation protein AB [Tissierellaceae bacterium]|nr:stage III sporulation protein AB [Tissierellaceae bacterium]
MGLLKILSAFCIFITSSAIGFSYGQTFSLRFENLLYLEHCIKILETEIVYGATPLPEALANVKKKGKPRVSFIFDDIRRDLISNKREAIYHSFLTVEEKLHHRLHLKKEDIEIFFSLGRVLGSSDREDQSKIFKIVLAQLEGQLDEAKLEKNQNAKLYRSLGIITGLGIIILLI